MTQGFETLHQAARDLRLAPTFEIVSAELFIGDVVSQNVVRGREHGGRDCEDGFLGASSTFEPEKLGAKISIPGSRRHPGGLDERRFEPWGTGPRAGRAPLPGAFVEARA